MASRGPSPVDVGVLAVRWAVSSGATEAEAYVTYTRGYNAVAKAGRIEGLEAIDEAGVGIRVAVGKRIGFAYASSFERSVVREAVERAVSLARASREDPYWRGLPQPSESYPEPGNMYSPELAASSPELVVEKLGAVVDAVAERGAELTSAEVGVSRIERAVVNTNGVYRVDVGTIAHLYVSVSVERNGVRSPSVFEMDASRVSMPSVEPVVEKAVEKALLCTRTVKLEEPRRMSVVLAGQALSMLYIFTIGMALRGDMVVRGRSPFKGRVGETVLSEKITIVDDGTLKGGFNTWRFDGEGVATRRNTLVERGVLRGFVYDHYWARRAGLEESTGNGVRRGYTQPVSPGYTNVAIGPGEASQDELLEGEVLVVYEVQGAHSSNPDTGEYSVLANPAVLYRGGEPVGWMRGVMVAGNAYVDFREKLEMLGATQEQALPGYYVSWARLRDVMVAPKA